MTVVVDVVVVVVVVVAIASDSIGRRWYQLIFSFPHTNEVISKRVIELASKHSPSQSETNRHAPVRTHMPTPFPVKQMPIISQREREKCSSFDLLRITDALYFHQDVKRFASCIHLCALIGYWLVFPFFSLLLLLLFSLSFYLSFSFLFPFFFSYLFGKLILHLKYIFFFNFASVFSIFGWAQVNVFDPLSASWILNWNWSCGGDECRDLTIHIQNSPRSHPWVFLLGQFRRHSRQYFRYSGILIGDKSGRLIADQFRRGLAGADLRARPVPNKSIRTFDRCNAIECGHILRILCLAAVRRPSQSGGHTAHDWSETISRR